MKEAPWIFAHYQKIYNFRTVFRTGATGASAPAEIKQRVRRTLPKDEFNLKVSHFGVKRS